MAGAREADKGPFPGTWAEMGCTTVTRESRIMTSPGRCTGTPLEESGASLSSTAGAVDSEGLPVAPAQAIKAPDAECLRARKGGSRSPVLT